MGMLVLTRRPEQKILIDGGVDAGGVTITIVEVRGEQVRVGIDAPRSMVVDREEVDEAKRQ